jgi:hypothetical protein
MWKWSLFCRIRHDSRRATVMMPTGFRGYACSLSRIPCHDGSAIRTSHSFEVARYSLARPGNESPIKMLQCFSNVDALICEKHVKRKMHLSYTGKALSIFTSTAPGRSRCTRARKICTAVPSEASILIIVL